MQVKEAYSLIKIGSLIVPKNSYNSGRIKSIKYGSQFTKKAQFPIEGLFVREIIPKFQKNILTGYELKFENKNNNFYTIHSEINFVKSKFTLDSTLELKSERLIHEYKQKINSNNTKIKEFEESNENLNNKIIELNSKLDFIKNNEECKNLSESEIDMLIIIKDIKENNKSDLDIAKKLTNLIKK